jgi:7-cyano-7-deazaguanine synthase
MASAVLLSGGLDSAVLLADEAVRGTVQPIYVSVGLAWEPAERQTVRLFLDWLARRAEQIGARLSVLPLIALNVDMRDVYAATHWAVQGEPPAYTTPDEDVYLPGRNIVLLGKAAVYCAVAGLDRIVLGTLAHNPFPDATPEFRDTLSRALSLGLAYQLQIEAPYAGTSKAEVIRRGAALGVPFEFTLSCMKPVKVSDPREPRERRDPREPGEPVYIHCGTCSKCRERHDAFLALGMMDPTSYADERFVRG